MRRPLAGILLATVCAASVVISPACAQWAVFDSANYAQNLLQAARALQAVNNQIRALQNQASRAQQAR